MSAPNPIFVSPSTTFVQVDPLQSPYNPVILNSVVYPGQVVSIRDATSSLGALTTPIVVSTIINNSFSDGSISTLINQPQGFVTAQSYSTNKWAFLNSFPFRNQFVSAGVLNLTTSTLFTAVGSSILEYVNSLTVENLTVTGNFVQSQGITLNTNVSSFGTVEFTSSLTVSGRVNLSSDMTVQGAVNLYSSLQVKGNFLSKSTITTLSSFTVSSFVSAVGSLSTPAIQLQDGLVGTRLEVQTSSLQANVGGTLSITSNLSTLGSLNVGGFLQVGTLFGYGDFLITSSASLYQTATVSSYTSTVQDVLIGGSLGVGGLLTVGKDLFVEDSMFLKGNGYIRDILTIQSTLITSSLTTVVLETFGNYANNSTIAQISSLFVDSNLGGRKIWANSTFIGGSLTAGSNLFIQDQLLVLQDVEIKGGLSSLAFVSVGKDMVIEGRFSTLQTLFVSSLFSTMGTLTVGKSTITGSNGTIDGYVQGLGNLMCDGTLTISSITLPSSLVANNFTTGNLFVGTYAITKDSSIPTVKTSSLTVGYIPNTVYPFDLSGSLLLSDTPFPTQLSTSLLSTQLFQVGLNGKNSFVVTNGMGVGVEVEPSTFVVNPLGYFMSSPVYVFSTLSTNVVLANTLQGTFIGDGALISNVQYPPNVSTFEVLVSKNVAVNINNGKIDTNVLLTSTFINQGSLYAKSTLTIGSLEIRGNVSCNTNAIEYNLSKNTMQTSPSYNLFTLNGMNIFGGQNGNAGGQIKRVVLNENYVSNVTGAQYNPPANLAVYNSLAVDAFAPEFRLNIDTYRAKKVIADVALGYISSVTNPPFEGEITILSGTISSTTGKFFLGEGESYDERFNTVQPYQSTLQFNSTLFVNRSLGTVGINTKPNFSLDAEAIGVNYTTYVNEPAGSTMIDSINLTSLPSTLYYAFVNSNGTYSNTLYGGKAEKWQNMTDVYTTGQTYIYNSYFTSGLFRTSSIQQTRTVFPENQMIQMFLGKQLFAGQEIGLITQLTNYVFAFTSNTPAQYTANRPGTFRSMATNGSTYIAVGTNTPADQVLSSNPMFFTTNLQTFSFSPIVYDTNSSNLFPRWDSPISYTCGGYGITYGGLSAPYWVAVGAGKNGPLYTSADGSTWVLNTAASFTGDFELRSVISVSLPSNAGTVFLAGGTSLTQAGNTYTNDKAYIFAASDPAASWTPNTIGILPGPVTSLASDGEKVVAAVNGGFGQSLWYSYITSNYLTSNNPDQWILCSGDLFRDRANSVLWNGSLWVAGGGDGIRQSVDGITWTNPGDFTFEVFGVGYMSNAATTLQTGSLEQSNLLYFQDSPSLECQKVISVATISYYSSSNLNLNNALLFDSNQNVIVPGTVNRISPLSGTTFQSTFYAAASYVSSFLSTNKLVLGTYILGVQNV